MLVVLCRYCNGVYAFLGADSAFHMAGAIPHASTVVSRVMVATTVLNGILGFAALKAILFCAGNVEDAERAQQDTLSWKSSIRRQTPEEVLQQWCASF